MLNIYFSKNKDCYYKKLNLFKFKYLSVEQSFRLWLQLHFFR